MSRAMQLKMSEKEVLALCATHKVSVSAIERLPSGGTRLVCSSTSGAELVRQKAKSKLIAVDEAREIRRPASPLW
ncbi:MAG TPA: hypothetical protein VM145_05845 [Sphingomicrobium sp.]|nr:hypothetical protein [Sphingomicrobium sp.]